MGELQSRIDELIGPMIPPAFRTLIDAMVDELGDPDAWGLPVGAVAPLFELPDAHGQAVALRDRLSTGPVVVQFYRGGWCPMCNLSVQALQQILPEIHSRGASLMVIGPQSPAKAGELTQAHQLGFDVLSDTDQSTIAAFRLQFRLTGPLKDLYQQMPDLDLSIQNADHSWNLPIPATFVLDQDGVVRARHVDPNYQRRMEPADILDALDALLT